MRQKIVGNQPIRKKIVPGLYKKIYFFDFLVRKVEKVFRFCYLDATEFSKFKTNMFISK